MSQPEQMLEEQEPVESPERSHPVPEQQTYPEQNGDHNEQQM